FISCAKKNTLTTAEQLEKDVVYLAGDSLEGRYTGSEGEHKAAAYIVERFKALKLQPKGDKGTYFQEFSFTPRANPHQIPDTTAAPAEKITGTNVIGYIDNKSNTTVVIGAHYDHLGYGGEGSLYREGKAIHNGADDNASGVALLLDMASKLQRKNTANNYLFVAFSGEELGLLGSNYFVKHATIPMDEVNYMLNFDMVGRLNEEKSLAVNGTGTSPVWESSLNGVSNDFTLVMKASGVGPSDHTSFYLNNIPVLHFFTGQHEDYHKPSDDSNTLNYNGMETISGYVFNLVSELNDDGKLSFVKTKDESQDAPRFKVTLGVVPDYMYSGKGMRIDGVTEDRPAAKAGLKKGDVVMKIGDYEIEDMMGYMKALSKFEAGQTAKVTVNREGKPILVDVTF
ncbi:MAG: M20/M25/M40 family metallo-hydrolase, partial [Sinomicrobium sp.]|nr:M20/M25/M40 family metallo-hydrolase [Sinomicrobium sp.]